MIPKKPERIAVYGCGTSGLAVARYLSLHGASVTVYDEKPLSKLPKAAEECAALGVPLYVGESMPRICADVIYRAPGIRPDAPALVSARRHGARVSTEIELFLSLCPCPVCGVTGSDGKTTTATLAAEFYRAAGFRTYLGGNIGVSLLDTVDAMCPADRCVLELSSFQLADLSPELSCAVVTNLTPNHLNWHTDMAEYAAAKERILTHAARRVVRDGVFPARRDAIRFSLTDRTPSGLRGGILTVCGTPVCPRDALRLRGAFNAENFLAAASAVAGEVPTSVLRQVAENFSGVGHRMETVTRKRGVEWIESSIDTTPSRTAATLAALAGEGRRILLLLGGAGKGVPFAPLAESVARLGCCREIYLFGASAEEIAAALDEKKIGYTLCGSMEDAARRAKEDARAGDTVLLSPACTSFDAYRDYTERAAVFRRIVEE